MQTVTLGKSGLVVPKNGFGALPIQRISLNDTVRLLHKALDGGMYYFDTARFYTDSEEKIGEAFHDRRDKVVISTKTGATTVDGSTATSRAGFSAPAATIVPKTANTQTELLNDGIDFPCCRSTSTPRRLF